MSATGTATPLTGLFTEWFSAHTAEEITAALSATSVLWERYRSFAEVVDDDRVTANPLFTALDQPRIGEYLAPGLPLSIDGDYPKPRWPHRHSATTPQRVLRGVAGAQRGRDRRAHRVGHRSMSATAGTA